MELGTKKLLNKASLTFSFNLVVRTHLLKARLDRKVVPKPSSRDHKFPRRIYQVLQFIVLKVV